MPRSPEFDFSKLEDQKEFVELPEKAKGSLVKFAEREAIDINATVNYIKEKLKNHERWGENYNKAAEAAIGLVDKAPEFAENVMYECLNYLRMINGGKNMSDFESTFGTRKNIKFSKDGGSGAMLYVYLGELATALGNVDVAKEAIAFEFYWDRVDHVADIAKGLVGKDPELVKNVIEYQLGEYKDYLVYGKEKAGLKWSDECTDLVVSLRDINFAKNVINKLLDNKVASSAGRIAFILADELVDADIEFTKQVMDDLYKCDQDYWAEGLECALAIAQIDNDAESAEKTMEKLFNNGSVGSARKIASALLNKKPKFSKKAREILKED